jgi:hypothetical protein
MNYVIWTTEEEVNLCAAVAAKWRDVGYQTVDPDNYREVIILAAAGRGTAKSWRPRTLKSRDARRFIEVRRSTLDLHLAVVTQPTPTYVIPGYDQPMTAPQMQDEIVRLNALLKELEAEDAPPTPSTPTPIVTRPKPTCEAYTSKVLPQKTRVAIAGVHDKHRDNISRAFPHLNITWIEPRDNDAMIKTKASGRPCIACTHGTNGNVLRLLHNISPKLFTVGGAHGVRETLAHAHFGN